MGLAPLRGRREAPQGRLTGGRGSDDLRAHWSGPTADYLAVMRVGEGSIHMCTSCNPKSLPKNIVRLSGGDARGTYVYPSQFGALNVSPMVDWDFETTTHGVVARWRSRPVYNLSAEGETVVLDVPFESPGVPDEIDETPVLDNIEDVLRYLRTRNLDDLAGDLEYKKCLIEEDPDELPISLESTREFAAFVAKESLAGSPNLMVDSYGYVGLEWIIPDPLASRPGADVETTERGDDRVWGKGDGVLGLWFLPNGLVRVCGTSGPVGQGVERMLVNSIVLPTHVMGEIKPFLSRLEGA